MTQDRGDLGKPLDPAMKIASKIQQINPVAQSLFALAGRTDICLLFAPTVLLPLTT